MHDIIQPVSPPRPQSPAYYQLIHSLTARLPPPVNDTPEARYARDQCAIETIAALLPVNPAEADLAALYVATRAQADHTMRQTREHTADIATVIKLNAQHLAMARTSISIHKQLLKVQALRHKREADDTARVADEWTQHIVASTMRRMLDGDLQPPDPGAAQAPPAPVPPPPQPAAAPEPHDAPGDAPDDLEAEADLFAARYPYQARYIRRNGGLPPDYPEGAFGADLMEAIICGDSPALRACDTAAAAEG